MFKNYLRIALRNLARNRFTGMLNIGGLAIGMAVAILIGLWLYWQVSYNKSFPNHPRIAAVMQNQQMSGGTVTWWNEARQLAPVLRKDYPGLFKHVVTVFGPGSNPIAYGESKLSLDGSYIDPAIIDMLGLDMVKGDTSALREESSIILSESTARSLFGSLDPMGKNVKVNNNDLLKVTGIYADLPVNSNFANVTYIIPFDHLVHSDSNIAKLHWGNSWFNTYVQMNDNVDMAGASRAIKDVKARYGGNQVGNSKPEMWLHPMDDWHLRSDFKEGVASGGYIQYVRLFAIIGVFVLLLACINFMNLSTARSEKRAREVGIRKAIGSLRGQLIRQFFLESVVITFISFCLSIGIAQLLLPFFNDLAGQKMAIPYGQPMFWVTGLCFMLLTGLLAGTYPALYLSAFKPVKVLKGTFRVGKLAALPRQVLVVIQFSVSVVLIIGTIAVFHQIQYVKDRPVGYDRSGLLEIPIQNDNTRQHFDDLRTQLLKTGMVEEVSASMLSVVDNWATNNNYDWRGKDPSMQPELGFNIVTPEFGKSAGWQIVEGRDFSRDLATDNKSFIINEAAARYMGFKHPIGEVVTWNGESRRTIIGVVRDMLTELPFYAPRQMIFSLDEFHNIQQINVRVKPRASMPQALGAIKQVFKVYDADNPFTYTFADQEYAKKFAGEERIGQLAGFFTILAIVISCLGLLGLSAFVAEQRNREVGIRKVLGASVLNLWQLLSREFVLLVGLSMFIGAPVAYLVMHKWLNDYAYHTDLSWWIFAVTALGAIGITLFTVSFQAIRAALANPVKALRSE